MSRCKASKKGAAQAAPALAFMLTKREARALLKLVDYVYRDEEAHFYSEELQYRADHIFQHIRVVALAVGYTTKAHLRKLDRQDAEDRASDLS